jgi:hypothetical protein
LPNWIADLLDKEGDNYDGPGVVAAAAIAKFCQMKNNEKIKAIQDYRNEEIKRAYSETKELVSDVALDESKEKKQTRLRHKE